MSDDDTDANGYYKITGLSIGAYRVRVDKYPYIGQYYPSAVDPTANFKNGCTALCRGL